MEVTPEKAVSKGNQSLATKTLNITCQVISIAPFNCMFCQYLETRMANDILGTKKMSSYNITQLDKNTGPTGPCISEIIQDLSVP